MPNSLFFKIKDSVSIEKHRILEIFFKDWIDHSCNNQVKYSIEKDIKHYLVNGITQYYELFRVDFDLYEDAVAVSLKGVPSEFSEYMELIS